MEKIIIHREDQDYGPYSLEQAKELASQGVLVGEDLAWMEGGTNWVPLSNLFSEAAPTAPLPAPAEVSADVPKAAGKVGFAILFGAILLVMAVGGVAVYDVKTLAPFVAMASPVEPAKSAAPANRLFEATTSIQGDSVTVTIITDNAHRSALCDEVMGEIYTVANQNDTANTIAVVIQVDGGKSAKIKIDDLAEVRGFSNMTDYVKSEHRDFISDLLVSAGLIDEIPAAR